VRPRRPRSPGPGRGGQHDRARPTGGAGQRAVRPAGPAGDHGGSARWAAALPAAPATPRLPDRRISRPWPFSTRPGSRRQAPARETRRSRRAGQAAGAAVQQPPRPRWVDQVRAQPGLRAWWVGVEPVRAGDRRPGRPISVRPRPPEKIWRTASSHQTAPADRPPAARSGLLSRVAPGGAQVSQSNAADIHVRAYRENQLTAPFDIR